MKTCTRCGVSKPRTEFHRQAQAKDGLKAACKECCNAYNLAYVRKHAAQIARANLERTRKAREWLAAYKKTLKCEKCGFNAHVAALEFHHRDPSQKILPIPLTAVRGWKIDRILLEIEKCDVLCANCHRIEHHQVLPVRKLFSDKIAGKKSWQAIEQKAYGRIRGNGRGWAFSQRDFARLGSRDAVDKALQRLHRKGTIRRVIRGIYDYPQFSDLLDQQLSPDLDQIAQALARKFGWRIQPNGPTAQNLIGLSTQVPGRIVYLSDGPDRKYEAGGTTLAFEHAALKEAIFKYRESMLLVQALKALGRDRITPAVIEKIRTWLDPGLREKVLVDTKTATGWVYEALQQICRAESDE